MEDTPDIRGPAVERMLTQAEVAAILRVSHSSVRRLILTGRLPATKVGRFWRVRPSDLLAFQERGRFKTPDREEPENLADPEA